MTTLQAVISWNPEIRNILGLLVGVIVLFGSVVFILGTNTGPRTGMLVGLAGLFGWMVIMGLIWWLFGIGMVGSSPSWEVIEVNVGDVAAAETEEVRRLPDLDEEEVVEDILAAHPELEQRVNPDGNPDKVISVSELAEINPDLKEEFGLTDEDLGGWFLLNPSDKLRGDAVAEADAALTGDELELFDSSADYKVIEAYDIGGKGHEFPLPEDANWLDRVWNRIETTVHFTNPKHYAIVQVQPVIPQETVPGTAPPPAQVDESAPIYSVVMIRNIGDRRLPGFVFTVVFTILFALTCWTLHRRDQLIARNRALATA